jgi:hypothetical protein
VKRLYNEEDLDFDQIYHDKPILISPLAEIEVRPVAHDHIKIDGQLYSVGIVNYVNKIAFVKPIDIDGEHDTEYTQYAVCPHCGHKHVDCFEWEDEGENNCNRCDLPFSYSRIVTIEYKTEKMKGHKPVLVEV